MANSSDAFWGRLSGRIGNLVVYQMYGKTVVRSRPAKRSKQATGLLKASQDGFKEVVALLSRCKHLLRLGFAAEAVNRSAWQAALSANLKNYREVENKTLDNWLQLSKGTRDMADDWQVSQNQDEQLVITWKQLPRFNSWLNDKLVVFILPEAPSKQSLIEITSARRSQEQAVLDIDLSKMGNTAEIFTAFIAADYNGNLKPEGISNSMWAGKLNL